MEWFKIIAPFIGVFIGWGLSEYGKVWADRKKDKRKLKRLLYFLLELRFQVRRELSIEKEISDYLKLAQEKLSEEFRKQVEIEMNQAFPFIKDSIKRHLGDDNQIEFLEANIDEVILELAEVHPIFAYELSGQYKIKDRLSRADKYFNEFDELIKQMPFDFKDWFQPKITQDLMTDLDDNVTRIAAKINRTTKNHVTEKMKKQINNDNSDLNDFLDDYINEIKKNTK